MPRSAVTVPGASPPPAGRRSRPGVVPRCERSRRVARTSSTEGLPHPTLELEVLVTHANAPLTPLGRRRLAVLIVVKGWPVRRAAERFQVSPATVRSGRAVTGRSADDRSVLAAARPARRGRRSGSSGASSSCASLPTLGTAPDQLPPRCASIDGRPGAGALPDAAAGPPRPSHRATDPQTEAGPLRSCRAGRSGARRHQEARPDPRRRWVARLRPRLRPGPTRAARTELRAQVPPSRGYVVPAPRRRRPLPAGLLRTARRRTQGDRRRVLAPRRERSSPTPASPSRP